MFNNYLASAEEMEGEGEGLTHTGDTFDIHALINSSKNYERKMGRKTTAQSAVRLGGGILARRPSNTNQGNTSDCRRRLPVIDDEDREDGDRKEREDREGHNRSVSSLLESLRMSPTRNSPDSGSFSMGPGEMGTDFTDNLPMNKSSTGGGGAVRMGAKSRIQQHPAPVRMGVVARMDKENSRPHQEPVRITEKAKVSAVGEPWRLAPRIESTSEQNLHSEVCREEQPLRITEEQARVRERLQHLSGSREVTDPIRHQVGSLSVQHTHTPLPPRSIPSSHYYTPGSSLSRVSQVSATPVPAESFTPRLATNPRSLLQTPAPPPAASRMSSCQVAPAVTPRERTMPPPSMAMATQQSTKDQVLIIRGNRYKVMKLLGKGGSSRVYEAFDEQRNTVVAIKRVNLQEADEATTAGYVNEIKLLEKLQGEDRIVKLYDHETVEDEDVLYVVMEKGDTDLASLLKKYASKEEMTPAMIKHYWTEMLHAVAVIHNRGVIHKDLKPANFLLVAGRLKLIDFGIASSVQSDKTSVLIDNQMGTFNFMSPESIQDLNGPQYNNTSGQKPCIKISFKSDVWSLGCILYNLTYGKMPFGDIKHALMKLQAITNKNHAIPFPTLENEDPVLVSLIKSCLVRDPADRPSIQSLLQHPYVTGLEESTEKKLGSVDALKMLAQLEGILTPNTMQKARSKVQSNPDLARRKLDG